MLLPNATFWLFLILWLRTIIIKRSEGFAVLEEGLETTKGQIESLKDPKRPGDIEVPPVLDAADPDLVPDPDDFIDFKDPYSRPKMLEASYDNLLLLPVPWIREEACHPIYGNIGFKILKAIEMFGPFIQK